MSQGESKEFCQMPLDKKIIFTFGRFNPPHKGHEKLINYIKECARIENAEALMVITCTEGRNDPLTINKKLLYCDKAFDIEIRCTDEKIRTVFDVLDELDNADYTDVTLVLGSDQHKLIEAVQNNRQNYRFAKLSTVLYTRQGTISASKMRKYAYEGQYVKFVNNVPVNLIKHYDVVKNLFEDVRQGLYNG